MPLRTLIVEDVHFLALVLQKIIEPFGEVDFAPDGKKAIDLFSEAFIKKNPYNLICLDLLLPEIDGFEVLHHIRHFEDSINVSKNERVKIIIVSALNDKDTVTKVRKAGCDGYIAKPFRKDKILEELQFLHLIPKDVD